MKRLETSPEREIRVERGTVAIGELLTVLNNQVMCVGVESVPRKRVRASHEQSRGDHLPVWDIQPQEKVERGKDENTKTGNFDGGAPRELNGVFVITFGHGHVGVGLSVMKDVANICLVHFKLVIRPLCGCSEEIREQSKTYDVRDVVIQNNAARET
eukprot:1617501-Pyramimonas_sp.AAC.1